MWITRENMGRQWEPDLLWHVGDVSLGSMEHNLPHYSPIWGLQAVSNFDYF